MNSLHKEKAELLGIISNLSVLSATSQTQPLSTSLKRPLIETILKFYFCRSAASTHQLPELCSTQVNFPALCSACHSSLVGHIL